LPHGGGGAGLNVAKTDCGTYATGRQVSGLTVLGWSEIIFRIRDRVRVSTRFYPPGVLDTATFPSLDGK
jgi:hypothetical protein